MVVEEARKPRWANRGFLRFGGVDEFGPVCRLDIPIRGLDFSGVCKRLPRNNLCSPNGRDFPDFICATIRDGETWSNRRTMFLRMVWGFERLLGIGESLP